MLVATVLVAIGTGSAAAATLFTDDFGDGNAAGWTSSGGSWGVASGAYRQTGTSSDARSLTGTASWTDYTVQATVRPTAFNGGNRFVALLARAQNATNYYYLALRSNGTVELKRLVGGSSATLASAPLPVAAGSSYAVRLEVAGSTLRGYVDGALLASATDTRFTSGRVGVATFNASAEFDDVTVSTGAGPAPTSASPTTPGPTTPPPTSPPPAPGGLVGWATQNGGTTGGAGGPTVTVTDGQALADALEQDGPLTIRVQGALSMPDKMNDVESDKTVLGAPGATLDNGLNISDAHNVIIRNLTFRGWDDDAINVQRSTNVWIDHNLLDGGYDGAVDVKRGSDFVTVSWNRVRNHTKSMLLGHDDGNASEDTGHLRVTYHHNWFDGSKERHPRVRFGDPVHVYNNYYFGADYGVASTMGAGVLVESNYFENVTRPTAVGYADSGPGDLVQRDNVFVNSGTPESAGTVNAIPYAYTPDAAASVKSVVTAGAGATLTL
ncbi:hypothetical protein JCM9533A_55250 [Catenuloplanes niger JCM 9533]